MTDPARVLVVDDEADVREVLAQVFSEAGFDACTAADGAAALELARGAPFDVVTMDLRMPGLSGLETFAALRRIDANARVVVVSGWLASADVRACKALGAFEVVAKPFDLDRLVEVVRAAASGAPAPAPT
jgi:DNA-binding NtrC family response regulator